MNLTVRVSTRRWRNIERKLSSQNVDAVTRTTALEIEADTKKSIQSGPKTGRIYRYVRRGKARDSAGRYVKGRKATITVRQHQASAPGQAPATDKGALVNSYRTRKLKVGGYRVGSSMRYARVLEFGGRRMKPRPHLRPAFSRGKAKFQKRLRMLLEVD